MLEAIDHPLRPTIEKIIEKAKPDFRRSELELLLVNILLYIKRVESKELTPEERQNSGAPEFHFLAMPPSTQLASTFYDQLHIINDYDIRSVSRIKEILIQGRAGTWPQIYSANQVKVLDLLSNNPTLNVSQLSQLASKSRPTITKILNQLHNDFGLRQGFTINRSRFKLSTFSIVFRTKSFEASQALEKWVQNTSLPFLGSHVFDLYYRNGFMVYSIPSQQRAFRLFAQRLEWLTRNFFQRVQIHEVFNLLWKARFEDYDVENHLWRIPKTLENYPYSLFEEAISFDEVRFQREMKTVSPIRFSRVDYLLANSDVEGGPTTKGKREFLRRFNYNLSNNTVWANFKRLKEKKAVVPYVLFAGAGLEDFICLSLYCDTQIQKIIQVLAHFLPFSYVYLTDKGIALFFKQPIEWTGFVNRIIKETPKLPGVQDLIVVYQESQSGIRLGYEIYSRWNEKRQYWEFTDDEI